MPFKLSEEMVDTLLDKLGTDDAFRDLFQQSPRKALASLGHGEAARAKDGDEGIWSALAVKELASKEAILASRDTMREHLLTAQATQHPITLDMRKD